MSNQVPVYVDILAGGRASTAPFITLIMARVPNGNDFNYPVGQRWINTANNNQEFFLLNFTTTGGYLQANWVPLTGGGVAAQSFEVDTTSGGGTNPVLPSGAGLVNFNGSTSTYTISTSANTIHTEVQGTNHAVLIGKGVHTPASTIAVGANGTVLLGATGADPAFALLTSSGGTITFTTGANSLNLEATVPFSNFAVNIQTITSTGTYTPTSGMVYCIIECLGGGGAGGGAPAATVGEVSAGAGGGAGEYARGVFTASNIGASKAVTIGAGGVGVSGTTGGSGTTTSVGVLITAVGGTGGSSLAASASPGFQAGAAGGTGGSGGSVRSPGQFGVWALITYAGGFAVGGNGGNSQYGTGGDFVVTNGVNGSGYGSGGSGASCPGDDGPYTGGNGASGVVIITEYIA